MNKELKSKLISFLGSIPDDCSNASLGWSDDGVTYSIAVSSYGGSLNITATGYRPMEPPNPPEAVAMPALANA